MIRFVKPTLPRVVVCVLVVTAFTCVIVGIAISIAMIVGSSGTAPNPTGEYVRLFIVNITMWGPFMLIAGWPISLPAILVSGMLAAYIQPPGDLAEESRADNSA